MRRYVAASFVLFAVLTFSPALRAQAQFFDANGVKLRYQVEGQGEPVLLIHGFTANIEIQWALPGIIQALSKDHQVICYDCRGHGRSGKPHDPKQYGMEMVEDAIRVLDHLKIPKAHVVGYSMGAMITCKLLTAHPERCLSATLGGAGGLQAGGDLRFIDALADSLDQGKGFGPLFEGLTPAGKPKPTPEQVKAASQMIAAFNDVKALAAVVRSWKELTVTDEKLKANRVPTLAIVGDQDPLKKNVDELKGKLAGFREVVIPGADHMNAFTSPLFVKDLREFLAKPNAAGNAAKP
jgi:pimeloyl-ACP methyl ester carboxylesterase